MFEWNTWISSGEGLIEFFYERDAIAAEKDLRERGTIEDSPVIIERKTKKYEQISSQYFFSPVALESYGKIGQTSLITLDKLGKEERNNSKTNMEPYHLFQRISVALQRGNSSIVLNYLNF